MSDLDERLHDFRINAELAEASKTIEALYGEARIKELEDRLEVYATNDDGTKTYLGIGDCDGIGCRDETIKLLAANGDRLHERLTALQQQFSWYDELRAACNKQLIAMVPAGATINLATLTITIALLPEIEQEKP